MKVSFKTCAINLLAACCIVLCAEGYLRHKGYYPDRSIVRGNCSSVFDPEIGWTTAELGTSSFKSKEVCRCG